MLIAPPLPKPHLGARAGGLDLDDNQLQQFAADSEERMQRELARLQDSLQALSRAARTKLDSLEAQLKAEALPERRQALMRTQRMVELQYESDSLACQGQITHLKAEHARHRLQLEQLMRLAAIMTPSPGPGARRAQEGQQRPPTAATPTLSVRSRDRARQPAARALSDSGAIEEEIMSGVCVLQGPRGEGVCVLRR
jgi:hypothetical protein